MVADPGGRVGGGGEGLRASLIAGKQSFYRLKRGGGVRIVSNTKIRRSEGLPVQLKYAQFNLNFRHRDSQLQ